MSTSGAPRLTAIATIVVPVSDQERSLAFYVDVLSFENANDFTYDTGERWLEVVPPGAATRLTLVEARTEHPAGIETGVILASSDARADLATLRAAGADVDDAPLPEGEVRWWAGAPLAGFPTQFLLRDPDGNSFVVVQAP